MQIEYGNPQMDGMVMRYYLKDGSETAGLKEARKSEAVPSVTTIINGCSPHEYKYLDEKRLWEVIESTGDVDEKMEILGNSAVFEQGNLVHDIMTAYYSHDITSDPMGMPVSNAQFIAVLSSFSPIHQEKFFWSEAMQTGGRIDLLAYHGEKTALVDVKSISKLVVKP